MNFHAQQRKIEAESLPIRSSVGIMLLNEQGKVFVGRRKPKWVADHSAKIWQMPQGGIEKFEPPRAAALRELREETGVTSAEVIAEHAEWLTYELPDDLVGVVLKGRYRGQRQKWFAMRFWATTARSIFPARAASPSSKPGGGRRWTWCRS